ncbi:brain-specific angiogenesis inhibitor 1-associated protein 2-like protein 2 [Scomber scombrus]|uniref:brain-specific angiogenesis inhibitor 1-associated protein 2-like protein 2 n=1 Tax=Scomber scombrus TaxID=13677 RepID=UPI002DD870B9|nr:brain-specific angiogenesis inhibitor 1-associated protein 2-like protein 2 [Scomber scombrus]
MSGMNSEQLHRSTLGIYSGLMNEFNPSLQKLVSLGNSYVRAFQALAVTSEAYFSALSNIGKKAIHTVSSRSIGDVLIQICESQHRLTMELEGVFRWFSVEVLQEMDNNIMLDVDYISGSWNHFEMEVQNQAAARDRQLWRGNNQDCSEYVQFLRKSHGDAMKEEERRYRFLAEKHCGLIQSITSLMNKTGVSLQQRADAWSEDVDATRRREARQSIAVDSTRGMKEEEMRRNKEEQTLGRIPSRAPSPYGNMSRSGESAGGGGGGGGATGGKSMRARVAHQPGGSYPTLLPFNKGEMITLLAQQPKNGWLFGRADSSSRQGWFPASYVEAVEDPQMSPSFSSSTLRSSSSMSSLYQPGGSSNNGGPPPPPPPPPPPSQSSKRSQSHESKPELFPRGTNPFATVKLKPTSTNDRSGPRLYR